MRRKVWVLQVLRHAAGVAGLVVGAVLSDTYDLPVAILVAALFLALLLGVRLLGLLGAGKDSLTLSERGIGVGPPDNLVVIPWPEIKSVELKDHSKRGTELTVHRDVVRQLPQGAQHPTWVRDGPAGALRIRTGRLAPLGSELQVSDAVRRYARRHRVKVVRVREG
ncbi:hypothetical protein [Streptomyces exfoliatus]|uniref:hypothetical protein n=1 Tax=Streptomyces exfoliatus TaxID=1905 RepID=UPI003C2FEF2F